MKITLFKNKQVLLYFFVEYLLFIEANSSELIKVDPWNWLIPRKPGPRHWGTLIHMQLNFPAIIEWPIILFTISNSPSFSLLLLFKFWIVNCACEEEDNNVYFFTPLVWEILHLKFERRKWWFVLCVCVWDWGNFRPNRVTTATSLVV